MGLIIPDQGGWAGSHYFDNEPGAAGDTGNSVRVYSDGDILYLPTHLSYNPDGSTYEAFWCPDCGAEVSLAMQSCPVCGRWFD